ncbi:hypothetical protein FQA39_LY15919 [Lamprigera yunnana]|nr:hypothetical protein FQA39_LY15919 [Lamprigera yunnana]
MNLCYFLKQLDTFGSNEPQTFSWPTSYINRRASRSSKSYRRRRRKIRQWLSKQQHLKVRFDDDQIVAFLRGSKYSLQKAKKKIDVYFTIRTLAPEVFHDRDPFQKAIQEIINAGCILPLPNPDNKDGARIIIWYMTNANPETMSFVNLCLVFFMILDILLKEDDNAIVSGVTLWLEATNYSEKYIPQVTPTAMKKYFNCIEKAYPLRIKAVHVTNLPVCFEILFNIVKTFSKSKIAQRVCITDIKNFYQELPQHLCPKEFGGENGSIETTKKEWKKKLESYRNWFIENRDYKSDESLRWGESRTTENVFGIEGSFRRMEFD